MRGEGKKHAKTLDMASPKRVVPLIALDASYGCVHAAGNQ
jgi:hypothetical protein